MALTLRAVGGLTTREIADAFYVPEATMAQRISRAKRTLRGRPLDQPGDLAVVLRVLYLIYTAGHAGRVDLAREAIRLARQLTLATEEPEARGLLALMLLNHARLPARFDAEGRIVTLDRQDRGLWDTREIAEGVRVLQSALALQRPGRYQVEAAIAALHDDAASAEETDWPQILAFYDDLVAPHRRPRAPRPRGGARPRGRGRPRPRRRRRAARDGPAARGDRRAAPLARRARAPARAGRRPARRRRGLRRGRRPRHDRRRARPPRPPGRPRAGPPTLERMTVHRMDHVGVIVDDLAAATAFFAALGLERRGAGTVEGRAVDRIVGLEGVVSDFAFMQTPDGHGRLELIKFQSPPAEDGDPRAPANTPGLRHLAFAVDDIHAALDRLQPRRRARRRGRELRDSYWLCYVRGPEGIIVELAEKIG